MSQIDAIFRNGVFEPLGPVDLKEEQRVRLNIEPTVENGQVACLACNPAKGNS